MEPTSSVVSAQALSSQSFGLPSFSQPSVTSPWLPNYQPTNSTYDEMWRQAGQIRAHWQPLMQMLATLGGAKGLCMLLCR